MKTSVKLGGLVAAALIATSGASFAAPANPYLVDSAKQNVLSGYGLCVRTGSWTPALAEQAGWQGNGCKCDKDILSAQACAQPAPPPPPAPKVAKVTLAADTLFAFDSAALKDSGKSMLDELVNRMAGMEVEVILATGYADRLGKPAYNQKLSEKRAMAVKNYLVEKGVDGERIQTEGRGTADAIVNCQKGGVIKTLLNLIDCLAPNRRAVIEVIGTRTVK